MADPSDTPPSPPDHGTTRSRVAALLKRGAFKQRGAKSAEAGAGLQARRDALERSVTHWHKDPLQRGRIAELHEETAGHRIADASRLSPGEIVNMLAPALDRHLKRLGHFKVDPLTKAKPPAPASTIEAEEAKPAEPEQVEEEAPPPRDWVDIQFVDMDDKPVSGIKYTLKLPSGKTVDGTTASKGLVYLDDLDSGNCELTIVEFKEQA